MHYLATLMTNEKTNHIIQVLAITVCLSIGIPSIYAEQVSVSIPSGTSVPGCEETDECFIPSRVTVHPGDEVVWSNDDSAAHTVTSGTAAVGPDGNFDSILFMAGTTFSHTVNTLGEYPYFCMVHPWMVGSVFVTVGGGVNVDLGTITVGGDDMPKESVATGMSSDGKVRVEITTLAPTENQPMQIEIVFRDSSSAGLKEHVNYDISATQNGKSILSEMGAHEHKGSSMYTTAVLDSSDPVDFEVTLNGFGLPDDESNWTGPKGEVVGLQVVPEFGTIAMIILGVALVSIIAVTAKTRVIPRL